MIEADKIRLSPGIKISAGGVSQSRIVLVVDKAKRDWSKTSRFGLLSNQNIESLTKNEAASATPKTAILPKLCPFYG